MYLYSLKDGMLTNFVSEKWVILSTSLAANRTEFTLIFDKSEFPVGYILIILYLMVKKAMNLQQWYFCNLVSSN